MELKEKILSALDPDGDHISQYGVLGMKWGIRRDRRTLREARKKNAVKNTVKSLSDDELRQRIMRIEMEQKLTKLMTPPPSAGKAFISGVVKNAGSQLLTTAAVGAGTYAMGKLAGRLGGPDLQNVVLNKKKK